MGTTQILDRHGSTLKGTKSKKQFLDAFKNSHQSTALATAPNTGLLNPKIFYASKQTSSEDRYVCASQNMEDQNSTTLSLYAKNKDSKVNNKKSKL